MWNFIKPYLNGIKQDFNDLLTKLKEWMNLNLGDLLKNIFQRESSSLSELLMEIDLININKTSINYLINLNTVETNSAILKQRLLIILKGLKTGKNI